VVIERFTVFEKYLYVIVIEVFLYERDDVDIREFDFVPKCSSYNQQFPSDIETIEIIVWVWLCVSLLISISYYLRKCFFTFFKS